MGEDELGEAREAEEVDLELVAGVVEGDVLHRAEEAEAGVVDEDVDAATLGGDALGGGGEVFLAGDVHLEGDGAEVFEVAHVLDAAGCGVDGVALAEEALGGRLAMPADAPVTRTVPAGGASVVSGHGEFLPAGCCAMVDDACAEWVIRDAPTGSPCLAHLAQYTHGTCGGNRRLEGRYGGATPGKS